MTENQVQISKDVFAILKKINEAGLCCWVSNGQSGGSHSTFWFEFLFVVGEKCVTERIKYIRSYQQFQDFSGIGPVLGDGFEQDNKIDDMLKKLTATYPEK